MCIRDSVKNQLEIVPVKWIDKVLEVALERSPAALPDEEVKEDAKDAAGKAAPAPASPDGSQDVLKH